MTTPHTSPTPSQIRSIDDLHGLAGRLEALLNSGRDDAPFSALVCHPHPAGGGTMHNKVVYHAMKALSSFGLPVLRFNFRGTGLSEGEHDNGHGEQDDVRAALDWLEHNFQRPILFAGFSLRIPGWHARLLRRPPG
jgi:alpha/beta superfamily hydrolase